MIPSGEFSSKVSLSRRELGRSLVSRDVDRTFFKYLDDCGSEIFREEIRVIEQMELDASRLAASSSSIRSTIAPVLSSRFIDQGERARESSQSGKRSVHSPRVEVVVSLIDILRHLLDARGVVLLINRYELLRELIKQLDLELVLVQVDVERLKQKENRGIAR